jgi:hypothetical protein
MTFVTHTDDGDGDGTGNGPVSSFVLLTKFSSFVILATTASHSDLLLLLPAGDVVVAVLAVAMYEAQCFLHIQNQNGWMSVGQISFRLWSEDLCCDHLRVWTTVRRSFITRSIWTA